MSFGPSPKLAVIGEGPQRSYWAPTQPGAASANGHLPVNVRGTKHLFLGVLVANCGPDAMLEEVRATLKRP
jgi:hypothetical protein